MQDPSFPGSLNIQDFIAARRQAAYEMFLARITGRSTELLSYDDVRSKLRAIETSGQVLREIPLDSIIGSVGRYSNFTRSFMPKSNSDRQRWSQVKAVTEGSIGLPPIEVYQISNTYFVRDGNHRVSVARQSGSTHIQAYVTEVRTAVPLEPNIQPDDLILKAEYSEFLETTGLRTFRPQADISLSVPGKYRKLQEHIEVHRYFMGNAFQREIPYSEAVANWYDLVYFPMLEAIRTGDILRNFPNRTEGDLYLWVSERRQVLQDNLEIFIPPGEAAADLVTQFSPKPRRIAARLGARIFDLITPDELEGGPKPGQWRRDRFEPRSDSSQIFPEILVPLGDQPDQWDSLQQAITLASREGAHLHGLHVTPYVSIESAKIEALKTAFLNRCAQSDLSGTFHVDTGKIARGICRWAPWMDLIVLSLAHPPQPGPTRRFSSGFRTILHRCPRPVLTVPGNLSQLQKALLAFDGSAKAREALYLAAYLNTRWDIPVQVLNVEGHNLGGQKILDEARATLKDHQRVDFQVKTGNPEDVILSTAQDVGADLILMGGYTASPWVEVLRGSTVERLLRMSTMPLLICR